MEASDVPGGLTRTWSWPNLTRLDPQRPPRPWNRGGSTCGPEAWVRALTWHYLPSDLKLIPEFFWHNRNICVAWSRVHRLVASWWPQVHPSGSCVGCATCTPGWVSCRFPRHRPFLGGIRRCCSLLTRC